MTVVNVANVWLERETAIVRNIMSGNNACGTLKKAMADDAALEPFLRGMVRPVLRVCADEAAHRDREIAALSLDNEKKRRALDALAANVPIPAGPVMDLVRAAMPGDPRLRGTA